LEFNLTPPTVSSAFSLVASSRLFSLVLREISFKLSICFYLGCFRLNFDVLMISSIATEFHKCWIRSTPVTFRDSLKESEEASVFGVRSFFYGSFYFAGQEGGSWLSALLLASPAVTALITSISSSSSSFTAFNMNVEEPSSLCNC
jgi:hypothetical protein